MQEEKKTILRYIPIEINPDLIIKELWADIKIPAASAKKRWGNRIPELIKKSKKWIKPAGIYGVFDCKACENRLLINQGEWTLSSHSLIRAIGTSKKIGLFITTIGGELEENAKKFPCPDDIILEAIGSAAAEQCAEYLHHKIIDPLIIENDSQKTIRLSPGWGLHKQKRNWDLTEQKIIFDILQPGESPAGVMLTSDFLMLPRKSVSAIVGIK